MAVSVQHMEYILIGVGEYSSANGRMQGWWKDIISSIARDKLSCEYLKGCPVAGQLLDGIGNVMMRIRPAAVAERNFSRNWRRFTSDSHERILTSLRDFYWTDIKLLMMNSQKLTNSASIFLLNGEKVFCIPYTIIVAYWDVKGKIGRPDGKIPMECRFIFFESFPKQWHQLLTQWWWW